MNYERLYLKLMAVEQPASKDTQFHHIVPNHLGRCDDRVVALTVRQHALAHLLLWKIMELDEDLLAYKMLKGQKNGETHRMFASLGGKVQGRRNADSNFINEIKTVGSLSLGGKRAVERNKNLSKGPYFNAEEHVKAARKGGSVQGKRNVESGHLRRISLNSKRNQGKVWINNGSQCKMIDRGSELPNGWKLGRKYG